MVGELCYYPHRHCFESHSKSIWGENLMIKKIEAWLRRIIAEVLREVLAEQQKVASVVEEVKEAPAHWKAELDDVKAQHQLIHPKLKKR
jgi:uncharacterized membrane-anchored protein